MVKELSQWQLEFSKESLLGRERYMKSLKNKSSILKWKSDTKQWFKKSVGKLVEIKKPQKRLVDTLVFDSFRIEKWLYEVFPGTYASANFYIPNQINKEGLAILASIGHWNEGKINTDYQNLAWFMVQHQIPILVYEHCGLGERREFWDPTRNLDLLGNSPVCEHCRLGDLTILTGIQAVNYFLSEIRQSLNFMYSFPFVKKGKVGITGASGGGSMSRSAGCYFEELAFCIPVCIIGKPSTTSGSCHEQITWGQGLKNVSASDLLLTMIPKPIMVVSEVYSDELKETIDHIHEICKIVGCPSEAMDSFIIKDTHGYTHPMIEAVYRFLHKNFQIPKINFDVWQNVKILNKELNVTKAGFLNREIKQIPMAIQVRNRIKRARAALTGQKLAELIGLSVLKNVPKAVAVSENMEEIRIGFGKEDNLVLTQWVEQIPGYYHGFGHVYKNNEPSDGRWFLSINSTLMAFWVRQLLDFARDNAIMVWHAEGKMALPLLVATVIGGGGLFPKIVINKLLVNYQHLFDLDLNLLESANYIPGILKYGDIDNIIMLVADKCEIKTRVDGFGRIV